MVCVEGIVNDKPCKICCYFLFIVIGFHGSMISRTRRCELSMAESFKLGR